MKIVYYFFVATALIIQSISPTHAQNTSGTEFWVTFGSNANPYYIPEFLNIYIRIASGSQATSGTIYFTSINESVPFSVGAYQVFTHQLTYAQIQASYNEINVTNNFLITNYSILISSEYPVSVYAMNHKPGSMDATNVLPITALGTEYYNISYTTHYNGIEWCCDAYAIVATENNTLLYQNDNLIASLNAGQVYYKMFPTDMTGAYITANNPVALFSLQPCAAAPREGGGYCGHLMQQMAPVKTWGKIFFVPVSHLTRDRVRIIASQNGTNITHIGGTLVSSSGSQMSLSNLLAGQFVEIEILSSENGCFIEANNPVGVGTFLTSQLHPNYSSVSLCWLPAIEQTINHAVVAPFIPQPFPQLDAHGIFLVTPTATKNDTRFAIGNGSPSPLSDGIWKDHPKGFSFYRMPLTNHNESYLFSNSEGMLLFGYGTGHASSYYYLASSAMRDLDAAFYANDIHFQDLKDTLFCPQTVHFRAEIEGELHPAVGKIKWFINGTEEEDARDEILWSKHFNPGKYEIKMTATFDTDETISKFDTLRIKSCDADAAFYINEIPHSELPDITFCENEMYFHAEVENWESLEWWIGGIEEATARDRMIWNSVFPNGTYEIELRVFFENAEPVSVFSTLNVFKAWIKMRNIKRE
jgi:hypothetical protein